MTPSEKRKQTIIDKWGSWEAYINDRYHNPNKPQTGFQKKGVASKAGKKTKNRTFNDPIKATKAGKKGLESRWGK